MTSPGSANARPREHRLRIVFTKLTNDRHRLEIIRDDGSVERAELETKSFLLHDLVHYAVEAEAAIPDGFWGSLAAGVTLAALSPQSMTASPSPGLALAESLVGPMQSLWNDRLSDTAYLGHVGHMAPERIDAAWLQRVRERLRRLTGHWRATPFHRSMELAWPPDALR